MIGLKRLRYQVVLSKLWAMFKLLVRTSGRLSKYPPFVLRFEQRFAKDHDCQYGISYCNGSSAIEAALFAVGVRTGDDVLLTSCSVHSTAMSVVNLGARPIYMDISGDSLNLEITEIERKITSKTKCIVVVHLWGNPADMPRIKELAQKHGLRIVEDCSHVHGATINGQKVGSWGDVGAFSLQGYKAVSAGEGGIAVTNSETHYYRLSLFGHFGRNKKAIEKTGYRELLPTGIGTKRRANPFGICLAAVDLKFLSRKNALKRQAIQSLERTLENMEEIQLIEQLPSAERGGFFPAYPVIVRPGFDKEQVREKLTACLGNQLTFGQPKFFKVPEPHYHQMPHMNDAAYGVSLAYQDGGGEVQPIVLPKLSRTEELLDRVILIPLD